MLYTRAIRERPELHSRVRHLSRKMFIDYPVAQDVVGEVEYLTTFEQDEREGRLIVAKTGNGKTYIAKRILRRLPPKNDPAASSAEIPIVHVFMPGKASRQEFAQQVLRALGQTCKPSTSTNALLAMVFALIPALGVKTILLDDFQHLNAGADSEKLALRNEIKKLGEECNVTMIGLGVSTALNVVNMDDQMLGRFEPIPIPLWKLNDDLRLLVHHLEARMALAKTSNLADNDAFLNGLIDLSEGGIGAIVKIIRRAAIVAMVSESEKIDDSTLKEIPWVKPSQRITKSRNVIGSSTLTHGHN